MIEYVREMLKKLRSL